MSLLVRINIVLGERHPQCMYKEATLNPTNPRDRAADWEADIIPRPRQRLRLAGSEIVGAQVVSVPFADATANAERAFRAFLIALAAVFAAIFIALNALLYVPS